MTIARDFPGFDAQTVASQGNAVLGIRDSGKSYTAVGIAERFHDAGIPFVTFDPIGKWRFLRTPGKGSGYPVVVAGGADGDLPLTVESAPALVRAAMQNGISLVIDLYDMEVSKADWKRIVGESVRVLLYENGSHGLRHIFIEEAAEFCPQRIAPDQGRVYAEIEKLARMGGNARLGYTLINQRAEEVNKAVLELCDNLFLHRQKGRNSLNALTKWLDVADVRAGREIVSTLPTLPQGECWAWMAGTERPVHVKVPEKNSFEPDRRAMRGDVSPEMKRAVDVGAFVSAMKKALAEDAPEPQAARPKTSDPGEKSNTVALEAARGEGFREGRASGWGAAYRKGLHDGMEVALARVKRFVSDEGTETFDAQIPADPLAGIAPRENPPSSSGRTPDSGSGKRGSNPRGGASAGNGLDAAALKLLGAFERYPSSGLTWEEACVVAGLVPGNGYFYGGKKRLVEGTHVFEENGRWRVTKASAPARYITKQEILATWSKLKQPAPRMLEFLLKKNEPMSVGELAAAIGAKPGNGYWYGGVAALRDANLVVDGKGTIRLSSFVSDAA